jgi:2-amino-4-hydroxy-6-hydroxymethyldihydropteridine diphosphokinase
MEGLRRVAAGTGSDGCETRATPVVLAMGSNVGDRLDHLRSGLLAVSGPVRVERVSSVYESAPADYLEQPDFLNAVVYGTTRLAPEDLLTVLKGAEEGAGRLRTIAGGPRTLDLDLVFYGSRVIRTPDLVVPHPRWSGRAFVCVPLLEVAPDLVDPSTGQPVHVTCAGVAASGLRHFADASALEEVL